MTKNSEHIEKSLSEFHDQLTTVGNLHTQESHNDSNEKIPKSIWTFFLLNPRLAVLAIVAIVLMGITALTGIDIEANPEINQPTGLVQTFYPNSSPSDVEEQVTNKLEAEIANLANIKDMSSSSVSNLSTIIVNFNSDSDTKKVIQDLKDAVSRVSDLPDDVDPQVIEFDFNNQSIVTLSVVGNQNNKDLTSIAEDISEEIESVSGVSKVELSGDSDEFLKINIDSAQINALGISLPEIIQAINGSNQNSPLGEIDKDQETINLRLEGKAETVEEISQIPIRNISTSDGFTQITLGQISDIAITEAKQETYSFVSDNKSPARSAISLNVYKQKGGNIVKIVEQIDAKISEINSDLPPATEIIKTNDNAYFIRHDINTLSVNGIQTVIIIFLSLLVFLSFSESFVAALALPLIFLTTFAYLYLTGQTLNGLTIFSLILSLGLIVDTSIVIVEGIHDFRKEGYSSLTAAYKSIETYKWPLIAGTLTTIAAFFPMLLVGGIVGAFIRTIPIVLTITLISSLFVSIAFNPLIASVLLKKQAHNSDSFKNRMIEKLRDFYKNILEKVIYSRLARIGILLVAIVLFFASLSLPITGILKAQLFPSADVPYFFINVEAPLGTTLEETRVLVEPIENILNSYPEIENYVLNVGRTININDIQPSSGNSSGNKASFSINLNSLESGREKSYIISENVRLALEGINSDLDIKVEAVSSGPPTAAPFVATITGSNLDELRTIASNLKQELEAIPGLINITTDFDKQPTEAILSFNKDILSYYGISQQQATIIIQGLTNGIDNGNITIDSEDYEIKTFIDNYNANNSNLEDVANLTISTTKGEIPISYLGDIKLEPALTGIPHLDRKRSVKVQAFTEKDILITELLPKIQTLIDTYPLPKDYNIKTGGEDEEIQKSFSDLFNSMFIAVILILVILVAVFSSFRQTIIVLSSIPLAVIGIFPGLSLLGLPLSFPAFLGIVMLTGIVVNDAIVLIDQINNNRKNGSSVKESIIAAGRSRLTPIILTSVTTILGLAPISLTDDFWRGLGFSVIFGLLTATFLTLFIIPILYSFFFREKRVKD